MKKIALALVLAAVSGAAVAEWVELGSADDSTLYADPATIRRSGNIVKMWSLFDFKSPQPNKGGAPFLSIKSQNEYDCKEERQRAIYLLSHAGNMGAGNIVYSSNVPENWSPLPPRSGSEILWKIACGKK